jgi:DNA-binding CsgD family transcriptional regulator
MTDPISRKIAAKVAEISCNADLLPGVVVIHDLRDWSIVWMSAKGLRELGVSWAELQTKNVKEYHHQFFNPEDAEDYVPKITGLLDRNLNDEILTFFQQVRVCSAEDWTWHMSSIKVLLRDDAERPLLSITMSFPIDAMHQMTAKAARLLEENNFLRRNSKQFAKLSGRERDVLRHLALGRSSSDSALELFISKNTVETHRKNIRHKLNTNSYFELSQYARAFDLV